MSKQRAPSLLSDDIVIVVDETLEQKTKDIKSRILGLLAEKTYGLTIEDVSRELKINRATASKYLFALHCEHAVVVRVISKAKLHYLKKDFGGGHD